MPRPLLFGSPLPYFPPTEYVAAAATMFEQQGFDFLLTGDQLNLTSPRSLWTPDIVPAAAHGVDIDRWLDSWTIMDIAALSTSKVLLGPTNDALRRTPVNLAQQLMSLDHLSKGRAHLLLGAGEQKQFKPYGLSRNKPFGHLEECVKIVKKFLRQEVVSHEGPIWNLDRALLALRPYTEDRPPPVLVAGGPGRAVEIAGRHADGWASYFPPAGDPEWIAGQIGEVRRHAEESGRDPDELWFYGMFMGCIAPTEDAVEEAVRHPIIRWDSACILPRASDWRRWGLKNPLGDDFAYARDFVPMDWSKEDALRIVDAVPPEAVRATKITGTPEQAAEQMQPYIDAGLNMVVIGNYAQVATTGDFGDAAGGEDVVLRTVRLLRKKYHSVAATP